MKIPILQTKLHIPAWQPGIIPRPRLLDRLRGSQHRRLTLISAPAGFGKTTLVAEWLLDLQSSVNSHEPKIEDRNIAWFSVDESDNSPVRYWNYLIAALQTATPLDKTANLIQSPQFPGQENLLVSLINELSQIATIVTFVLDDYHLIENSDIQEGMVFLLENLPAQIHIVLITRMDPPFPLPRLRARGELLELRGEDLRFLRDETASFFAQIPDVELSEEAVDTLDKRIEGWVAGLQLAGLALQGQPDPNQFIDAFTGSHTYVLDYLSEEVLKRQPTERQQFLLQTSILSRLTAPLCDAILSPISQNTAATLQGLASENLFTFPLDSARQWYRYHPLFADLLRHHLAQTASQDEISTLHQRAATWYEQNGWVDEAISHWLQADELDRTSQLIANSAREMLIRGEGNTLQRWLDALPSDWVQEHPHLSLAQATLLTFTRDIEGVELYLSHVERGVNEREDTPPQEAAILLGGVDVYRGMIALWRGQIDQTIRLCQSALKRLEESDSYLRGLAALLLGMTHRRKNDLRQAVESYKLAIESGRQTDDIMLSNSAANSLAEVYILQGRLHAAAEVYRQALELASDSQGHPFPVASGALLGLAAIHLEWNELDKAETYLEEAGELTTRAGLLDAQLEGTILQALVKHALGNRDGTYDAIQRAEEIARESHHSELHPRLKIIKAKIALLQGHLQPALEWAKTSGLHLKDEPDELNENQYLFLVAVTLAQARERVNSKMLLQTQNLLDRLHQMAVHDGRLGSLVAIMIYQTLTRDLLGDRQGAMDTLSRALAMAEPEGFTRVFVDQGEPMAALLRHAAHTLPPPRQATITRLLASFQQLPVSDPDLPEPLSEREIEVLRLIAAGLSNQQIAETLVIALSTVKRHNINLYRKLQVNNRTQAAARGRELGYL